MTEQQILDIARRTGFTIVDSPVWAGVVRRFIEELLREINQEQKNV